jgi:hypothetical protein
MSICIDLLLVGCIGGRGYPDTPGTKPPPSLPARQAGRSCNPENICFLDAWADPDNRVYDSATFGWPLAPFTPGDRHTNQHMGHPTYPSHHLGSHFNPSPLSHSNFHIFSSIVGLKAHLPVLNVAEMHSSSFLSSLNSTQKQPFFDISFPYIHGSVVHDDPYLSLCIGTGTPKNVPCAYDMQWMPFMQYQGFPPVTG